MNTILRIITLATVAVIASCSTPVFAQQQERTVLYKDALEIAIASRMLGIYEGCMTGFTAVFDPATMDPSKFTLDISIGCTDIANAQIQQKYKDPKFSKETMDGLGKRMMAAYDFTLDMLKRKIERYKSGT